ncbi:MAG: hypothetical protein Q4G69_01835 [Planctomycetia bacterium]|nr:hypothetical protein [Planctomycetia bacterium]
MPESNSRNYLLLKMAGGLVLLALIVLAFAFFYKHKPHQEGGTEYAFNGWLYDRETQKEASGALVKAGLNDFSWKEGKLSVPKLKEREYESVLAENRIFPKAPSDVKRDVLREMGPFESESKIRMRDLYSAAWQLEQTIEQFSTQIEYATVGVRSRREQVGMIPKNIITASVGVWPKEEKPLSRELISSITLAARHHLGIAENENISIIDLRQGRSWLGTVDGVQDPTLSAFSEELRKEEENWQKKFQMELGYIPGIRISASVLDEKDLPEETSNRSIAFLGHPVPGTFVSHYPSADSDQKIFRTAEGKSRSLAIHISVPEKEIHNGNSMDPEGEKARITREIRTRSADLLSPYFGKDQLTHKVDRIVRISFYPDPTPKKQIASKIPAPNFSPILPQYGDSVDLSGTLKNEDKKKEIEKPENKKDLSPGNPQEKKSAVPPFLLQWKDQGKQYWNQYQKEIIGGLILFVFSLLLIRSVCRKSKARKRREEETLEEMAGVNASRGKPSARSKEAEKILRPDFGPVQQEVRELIEQNPEQAARIIQRWIRTGA